MKHGGPAEAQRVERREGLGVVAIYLQKTVHEGLWARRMALFFLQLLILTVLLHRFGTLATCLAADLRFVRVVRTAWRAVRSGRWSTSM